MMKAKSIQWMLRSQILFVLRFVLVVLLVLIPVKVLAISTPEPWVPTTAIALEGQYARLPDWSQITFHTLPPIQSDGSVEASPEINQILGYDLSRSWQSGQTAETYLKLGDFQTSLYPQIFNLHTIAQLANLNLDQVALSAFAIATWQTLDDLVTAIPGLGNYRVTDIPAIAALLQGYGVVHQTIAEVLKTDPALGQLSLGALGEQLNQWAITSIPGLENIPLQNLRNWSNSFISDVPGLGNIPFDQMPHPIETVGLIGTVDVAYGPAERDRLTSSLAKTLRDLQRNPQVMPRGDLDQEELYAAKTGKLEDTVREFLQNHVKAQVWDREGGRYRLEVGEGEQLRITDKEGHRGILFQRQNGTVFSKLGAADFAHFDRLAARLQPLSQSSSKSIQPQPRDRNHRMGLEIE